MRHSLDLAMKGLLATGAFVGLQELTKRAFRFPMTTASARIPYFGPIIAICIGFPVDLLICLVCTLGYVLFGVFSIVFIFVTMIKLIFMMWRGSV
jgi:hypothetical protein